MFYYRFIRDSNPALFALERGWQLGTGKEMFTNKPISRTQSVLDFLIGIGVIKLFSAFAKVGRGSKTPKSRPPKPSKGKSPPEPESSGKMFVDDDIQNQYSAKRARLVPKKTEVKATNELKPVELKTAKQESAELEQGLGELRTGPKTTTKTIKKKFDDLKTQGHGPQRHEGDVTTKQLEERCTQGKDPLTGTTTDGVHGGKHGYGRHATKVNTPDDYVKAHDSIKNGDEFKKKIKSAEKYGEDRVVVDSAKLKDIYGDEYATKVTGRTRVGSMKNPKGSVETDFTDGTMTAVFDKNAEGGWDLTTMYPQPKQ